MRKTLKISPNSLFYASSIKGLSYHHFQKILYLCSEIIMSLKTSSEMQLASVSPSLPILRAQFLLSNIYSGS